MCVFFLYHHLLSKCPSESYVVGGGSKCLHSKIERWKYKKKKPGRFVLHEKRVGALIVTLRDSIQILLFVCIIKRRR